MSPFDAVIVGLLVGAPATYFGIKALRRTEKKDAAAILAAQQTTENTQVQQVIDGLNLIIEQLQEDRADLREQLRECQTALGRYLAGRE